MRNLKFAVNLEGAKNVITFPYAFVDDTEDLLLIKDGHMPFYESLQRDIESSVAASSGQQNDHIIGQIGNHKAVWRRTNNGDVDDWLLGSLNTKALSWYVGTEELQIKMPRTLEDLNTIVNSNMGHAYYLLEKGGVQITVR